MVITVGGDVLHATIIRLRESEWIRKDQINQVNEREWNHRNMCTRFLITYTRQGLTLRRPESSCEISRRTFHATAGSAYL